MCESDIQAFFFNITDKIDVYWNLLVITLVAFAGWLLTTERTFTVQMKATLVAGYIAFALVNFYSLYTAHNVAMAAQSELVALLSHDYPALSGSLQKYVDYELMNFLLIGVHLLLAPIFIRAILMHKVADSA